MGSTFETVTALEFPKYKCHKEVHALKIGAAERHENGTVTIQPDDPKYGIKHMDARWGARFKPENNDAGYLVVYDDGDDSWSPSKAFEDGHTRI